MRSLILPAAGRNINSWRKHIKIDLDIQSNKIINKVSGQQAIIPANMAYSTLNGRNVAVFNSSCIGGIQIPHDPALAARTGDFTLEAIIDADGMYTEPVDNSQIIPFCMWGTWAAPGQTMQLDAIYNHRTLGLSVGRYDSGVTNFLSKAGLSPIDLTKVNHYAFQRKSGVGYIYVNGVLVHTAPYTADLLGTVNGPFRIMSRRGGGAGDVWWRFIGKLIGFRYTHAAIYNGPFTPPANF